MRPSSGEWSEVNCFLCDLITDIQPCSCYGMTGTVSETVIISYQEDSHEKEYRFTRKSYQNRRGHCHTLPCLCGAKIPLGLPRNCPPCNRLDRLVPCLRGLRLFDLRGLQVVPSCREKQRSGQAHTYPLCCRSILRKRNPKAQVLCRQAVFDPDNG
jgi:hypothetical protein